MPKKALDFSNYKKEIDDLKKALEAEKQRYIRDVAKERDYYENILALMPGHVYWLDKNNVFLGCNDLQAEHAKLNSRHEIVGKTNFDLPWKNEAEELNRVNNIVMNTNKPIVYEEVANMSNGLGTYLSQKVPLKSKTGEVIGILGISIDITEQKRLEESLKIAKETAEETLESLKKSQAKEQKHREKSEQLAIENVKHKAALEAQAEFTRTINEAAHDIASPMGSLLTVIESLCELEEITTVDGFNIALLSEKARQKEVLYIQKNDSGLDFEVIGSDETLKKGHISWGEICINIKEHAPANQNIISAFQKECLAILLNILVDRKIIGQNINEKRVPDDYRTEVRYSIEKISDITNKLISRYTPDADNKNESKQLV